MKRILKSQLLLVAFTAVLISCGNSNINEDEHGHAHGAGQEEVHLTPQQFSALEMKVGMLTKRNMGSYVEVNGRLEVPPQNEASVTAIIGANVTSIKVIEGDKIEKGQVLAYLSHPDLIKVQTDYISNWSALDYLEQDYERQKQLYEENVSSGRQFQKVKADYLTKKGMVKGLESQLKLMGMRVKKIQDGYIYENVPVKSPIEGYIRMVEVKTGQYVQPQTEMFEVVNIEHIHADFMVFEKDMHKVKVGQKINFTVSSMPDKILTATIHSVGKAFEQDPKAIHLHAEIENKKGMLIPGMYVRGKILIDNEKSFALPDEAVIRENDSHFMFSVKEEIEGKKVVWTFKPIEIKVGKTDDGWVEVKLLKPLDDKTLLAINNVYIIMAELKKEEAEHSH